MSLSQLPRFRRALADWIAARPPGDDAFVEVDIRLIHCGSGEPWLRVALIAGPHDSATAWPIAYERVEGDLGYIVGRELDAIRSDLGRAFEGLPELPGRGPSEGALN